MPGELDGGGGREDQSGRVFGKQVLQSVSGSVGFRAFDVPSKVRRVNFITTVFVCLKEEFLVFFQD